jgi:serine/threonine protein kinase
MTVNFTLARNYENFGVLLRSFQVARAMLFAVRELHSFGLVHRDVKPGNFCLPTPEELLRAGDNVTRNQVKAYLIDYGEPEPRSRHKRHTSLIKVSSPAGNERARARLKDKQSPFSY